MDFSSTVCLGIFGFIAALVLREVNGVVKEPYMDEPFHIPQAQAYCLGNWTHWDDKITTPPALYIYSIILQRISGAKCSIAFLRSTCTLLLIASPIIFRYFLSAQRQLSSLRSSLANTFEAIVLASFPILWFFGFLYYTELPSVVFTVGSFILAQRERHISAALLGLAACATRQTNVLWILYAFAYSQLSRFRYAPHKRLHNPIFRDAKACGLHAAQ